MNWEKYFDNLAIEQYEEHRKAGWGSKGSQLSKFHAALDLILISNNFRLLDIGCGTGVFEELLLERYPSLDVCAIDTSKEQLRIAKEKNLKAEFKTGSILNIPYLDSFFGIVTCMGVLQNFNGSLSKAIAEMKRVLRKGGFIFLITLDSACIGFKSGRIKKNPINTYYVPEKLKDMIESNGFLIKGMDAISTKEIGKISPLHQWHTFFILGEKQ